MPANSLFRPKTIEPAPAPTRHAKISPLTRTSDCSKCCASPARVAPGFPIKAPLGYAPSDSPPHDSQWLRGIPLSPLSCPPHFEPTSSRPFYGCILRPVFSLRCRGLSRFLWQDATKMGLFPLGPAAVAQNVAQSGFCRGCAKEEPCVTYCHARLLIVGATRFELATF